MPGRARSIRNCLFISRAPEDVRLGIRYPGPGIRNEHRGPESPDCPDPQSLIPDLPTVLDKFDPLPYTLSKPNRANGFDGE